MKHSFSSTAKVVPVNPKTSIPGTDPIIIENTAKTGGAPVASTMTVGPVAKIGFNVD